MAEVKKSSVVEKSEVVKVARVLPGPEGRCHFAVEAVPIADVPACVVPVAATLKRRPVSHLNGLKNAALDKMRIFVISNKYLRAHQRGWRPGLSILAAVRLGWRGASGGFLS